MSSHTQTKPSVSHPLCLASLLCLGSTVALPAQEDHHLGVRGAVEVEFEAERGHSYRLQRSTDLVHWEDVGEEVYGHGRREDRLLSTRERESGGLEVFRVVAREASTEGPAPWVLTGVMLNLDDAPGGDVIRFLSETDGVDQGEAPDPFTYQYTRLGTHEAKVEITYARSKVDVLTLTFTTSSAGTWVRDEYRKGRLKDRDTGVFAVLDAAGQPLSPTSGGTEPPPKAPAEVPATLGGLTYTFQSGETPERLEFTTPEAGTEFGDDTDDDEPNTFTYTYTVTGALTARLVLRFKADKWDEYDLTFQAGANTGTFVRREFDRNVLKDTDTGSFRGGPRRP